MQVAFLDNSGALVMPVTPPSYIWDTGRHMETLNLSDLGDVFRPGGRSRFTGSFAFLLPAQDYPFMEPEARADPQYYIDKLESWAKGRTPVRLVITGTDVNCLIYLETVSHGEKDGSGDVYLEARVREYVPLTAQRREASASGNAARPGSSDSVGTGQDYRIRSGDTLSAICRRFYGSSSPKYYNALAKVNGIRNPHLIYAGRSLHLPPERELMGGAS